MLRKMILSLIVVYLGLFNVVHAGDLPYKPGELIVRFAPDARGNQLTITERNRVLTSIDGGNVKHLFKLVPGLCVVKLPESSAVKDALATFKNVEGILYAEPNYRIRLVSTFPNDPKFNQQWGMYKIDAPAAWDVHTGSSSIIVAVLDTGIDRDHPDLSANMWVNSTELFGDANVDDDGNGYVDDLYGWDFGEGDNDPSDYRWHGTHCAGIAGAVGNNSEGVAGTCWDVTIMNVKCCEPQMGREAFVDAAIDAIEYAVQMGANVLSCSWRIDDLPPFFFVPEALRDAVEAAGNEGVLLVAAAGNDGENIDEEGNEQYPASYDLDNIIAVLATESDDSKWTSSNYGPTSVDLGAPGTDILSTTPTESTELMQSEGIAVDYDTASGTSMATPHVAGACALLWSVKPQLSHLQVKQTLMDTVDEIDALDGLCVTGGRLNVYNAVSYIIGTPVFKVKNGSGEVVAWFTNLGNLVLRGTVTENSTPSASANDEFRVQNSAGTDVAIIDGANGNMYIKGWLYEIQTTLSPSPASDDFIIKNSAGTVVAYIDQLGNVYLQGRLYENSNP